MDYGPPPTKLKKRRNTSNQTVRLLPNLLHYKMVNQTLCKSFLLVHPNGRMVWVDLGCSLSLTQ